MCPTQTRQVKRIGGSIFLVGRIKREQILIFVWFFRKIVLNNPNYHPFFANNLTFLKILNNSTFTYLLLRMDLCCKEPITTSYTNKNSHQPENLSSSFVMLSTHLTRAAKVFRYTCPNHLNLFSRIFSRNRGYP